MRTLEFLLEAFVAVLVIALCFLTTAIFTGVWFGLAIRYAQAVIGG